MKHERRGGGDVKLIAALALWAGTKHGLAFAQIFPQPMAQEAVSRSSGPLRKCLLLKGMPKMKHSPKLILGGALESRYNPITAIAKAMFTDE